MRKSGSQKTSKRISFEDDKKVACHYDKWDDDKSSKYVSNYKDDDDEDNDYEDEDDIDNKKYNPGASESERTEQLQKMIFDSKIPEDVVGLLRNMSKTVGTKHKESVNKDISKLVACGCDSKKKLSEYSTKYTF